VSAVHVCSSFLTVQQQQEKKIQETEVQSIDLMLQAKTGESAGAYRILCCLVALLLDPRSLG
jgi:hypothetical protein